MAKRKDLEYDRWRAAGGIKLMATYMYKLPFQQFNMGYCPCVAAGLFLLITSIVLLFQKSFVVKEHY